MPAAPTAEGHSSTEPTLLPSDSDHRINKIWTEFESVEPYLLTEAVEETLTVARGVSLSTKGSYKGLEDIFPVELHIPNRESKLQGMLIGKQRTAPEGTSFVIVLHP
jgi:phosphoinositide-3-kinase, regulatory subunit 4